MIKAFSLVTIAGAFALSACSTTGPARTPSGNAKVLQGGEWSVEDIGGRGIIDDSRVTLLFGSAGELAGSATCNRLVGTYTVADNTLSISPTGLTMMACPPALMDQERRFVDLLRDVRRFHVDGTGALVLETSDGDKIMARR